jgi:pimeloyl-ACP methyl ester carboxylesterase
MAYLFIHGAWHNRSCWASVLPLLNTAHQAITIDLPGHGPDTTSYAAIGLNTYVEAVKQTLLALQTPVVLVGHSLGGMVISQVAEEMPEAIQSLIYVSGFLPKNGQSLLDIVQTFSHSELPQHTYRDKQNYSISLRPSESLKSILSAPQQLTEPLRPFSDTVSLTQKHFGRVKKVYILCGEDKVIKEVDQLSMVQAYPDIETKEMRKADHCPFYSDPEQLGKLL